MSRRIDLLAQQGYSMVAVVLVMLATGLLTATAFAAVGGDIPFARDSQDRKQAYAAAEAGIEYYLYQLARDNDYWTKCASGGPDVPINMENPPSATRKWRAVAGSTARYSIELLPGEAACDTTKPEETMLDSSTGTFRIRSTGESRGERRTIVSTYRRSSFLDYLYFTDYEASDPLSFADEDDVEYARDNCVQYRATRNLNSWCRDNVNITFPDFDAINGPLHTNDDLLTCGAPDFGRTGKGDRIEISGPASDGWTQGTTSGCGAGPPNFRGIVRHPAATLTVPTSNTRLKDAALPEYRFSGATTIVLKGTVMDVTTPNASGVMATTTNMALPSNGVIYVEKDGVCSIDAPRRIDYTLEAGDWRCAVLTVRGNYSKSMTFGSEDDVLINEDITRNNESVVLGLIANRFVRVKHDVEGSCGDNETSSLDNIQIDAAMLALNDSFIVDNYQCGNPMGTLTVRGAIAQKFRGPVGTFSGSSKSSGYTKNYNYDDRLRYRSPPYFLDPVSAAWRVIRSNEQAPGTD